MNNNMTVLVKGAGDVATAVIRRLHVSGFRVVATEIAQPTTERLMVAFSNAIFDGEHEVEGVRAVKTDAAGIEDVWARGCVPVIIDPTCEIMQQRKFDIIIDAIMAKRNTGLKKDDAEIVIGLGPGFNASVDCDAVVETVHGHYLGTVIWEGSAAKNTKIPEEQLGMTHERVFFAPCDGVIHTHFNIGDMVEADAVIADVEGQDVRTQISGVVRGIIHDCVRIKKGKKLGDVDPRGIRDYCYAISYRSYAIAGGVLEACLTLINKNGKLNKTL